ncbi:MAG: epoxyqueuosine reductase [Deltaproteobacteria bacterium]|nr:epoxyqueuosine reductase [Deltaproteobacteria bacterium]
MTQDIGTQIIEKAKSLGASLAGIASVNEIKKSPSYEFHEKVLTGNGGVGPDQGYTNFYGIKWPENAKSALVIALSHPHDKPELDWFLESRILPGNKILMDINRELAAWIKEKFGIKTHWVNYWIWEGGMYLKDLAVLSGFGRIGKNNLLITPEYGPRVRLRTMLIDEELTPTSPIDFDPCEDCEEFCHNVCPQNAFDNAVISPEKMGMATLPSRGGNYSRAKCAIRSDLNLQESGIKTTEGFWSENRAVLDEETAGTFQTQKYIMFCRRCEFACPVGT